MGPIYKTNTPLTTANSIYDIILGDPFAASLERPESGLYAESGNLVDSLNYNVTYIIMVFGIL